MIGPAVAGLVIEDRDRLGISSEWVVFALSCLHVYAARSRAQENARASADRVASLKDSVMYGQTGSPIILVMLFLIGTFAMISRSSSPPWQ